MAVAEAVDLTAAMLYCVIPLWYLSMARGVDSRPAPAWLRERGGAACLARSPWRISMD